jgi:C1A family cysteine protease
MSTSIVNIANAASLSPGIAPPDNNFVSYLQKKTYEQISGKYATGTVPTPINLSHPSLIIKQAVSFPAKYDLRTLNKVTPVKDQGQAGSCWAHATYGSLESFLMPGQQWSFSENNMKNMLSSDAPQGFDRGPQDGGQILMSTAYLSRWSGPVKTSNDPYSDTSTFTSAELNIPIQQHVQNVYYLPIRKSATDNDVIKSAIQTYGSVYTTYYHDFASQYYNSVTHSYYKDVSAPLNHAVTIVGWNDNYDKNNFTIAPPGNGAFIVKNSWGTSFGENGFFYVSYYDASFGYSSNAVVTSENTSDYKNIYQYDPLGWCTSYGWGVTTGWGANVFTATSNDPLEAVSFYTTDSNCNYNIYIGNADINSRTLVKSGNIAFSGYHTIPLSSPVSIATGQKFSVIIQLTNPSSTYTIPVEYPMEGYSSKATANASESFVSSDGSNWNDITSQYPNMNVCIKAFTGNSVSSNNDNLVSLTISSGTLTPAFASSNMSYTDSVSNSVSSVTVTPTAQDSASTIKVNGIAATSGQPQTINLNVGPNTIKVVVTAQDGTSKTYTIIVTRAAATSSNNNLASLTISSGTLIPAFASGTMSYTDSVYNSVSSVTVTPTVQDSTATIKVNGVAATSGQASQPISLAVGPNTIKVVVTAQDGTSKTYTIIVTKATATSNNNNLATLTISSGTLNPRFSSSTTTYTDSVAKKVSSVTVTSTTSDSTATIVINGRAVTSGRTSQKIDLNVGTNTITIVVTAQSGATKTYTITVTKA